jgi:hypothetical protein
MCSRKPLSARFAHLQFGLLLTVLSVLASPTPSLLGQSFQLEAYGHSPDTLVTGLVTSRSGVVRNPSGTPSPSAYYITSHPAGTVVTLTSPTASQFGTPLTFLGWAPTPYDPVTGFAAAITTNPLAVTLDSDRLLVGYNGRTVADALNTPGRTWTSGGHALWTGTFDVFGPEGGGCARATTLRDVGDEAWLESTFDAPTIISYAWRLDVPTGAGARLEMLTDGTVADTFSPGANWQTRTIDLTGSGPVKVRFRLTHTATSTIELLVPKRESAYVTQVRTGVFSAPAGVVVSNTSETTATLGWQAAFGAQGYTVELADSASFSQIVSTQDVNASTLSATFYGLTSGTTYHYRVISRRTGHTSLSSAAGSFVAVTREPQSITFPAIPDKTLGAAAFSPGASTSSGLPVSYTVVSGPAHFDDAGLLHITETGTVVVRADQPGNNSVQPANSVSRSFSVFPPTQASVQLAAVTTTYTGEPQPMTAVTDPPGLQVTYLYQLGKAAATNVAPTQAGTYAVTATVSVPGIKVNPAKATLKILKAPLLVKGVSVDRFVGQANPPLSLIYTGFLSDDSEADLDLPPTPVTKATAKSKVGNYPITFKSGQDNNYSFVSDTQGGYVSVRGFERTYEALVVDEDELPTGKLTLTPSQTSLTYTGSLLLAGEATAIRLPTGRFLQVSEDLKTGTDSVELKLPATKTAIARSYKLQITLNSEEGTLIGDLQLDDQPYAELRYGRSLKVAAPRATTGLKGTYTILLPSASDLPTVLVSDRPIPEGAGYAVATITDSGKLTMAGKLADGTSFTIAAQHDDSNAYRLFAKPYGKRLGQRLGGYLPLTHSENFQMAPRARNRMVESPFVWEKPGLAADKSYRQGFGPAIIQANMEQWLPPIARVPAKGSVPETPALSLVQRMGLATTGPDLGLFEVDYLSDALSEDQIVTLPPSASLQPSGKVSLLSAGTSGFKLKVTPKTGAFTGEFQVAELDTASAKPVTRKVKFAGALRQGSDADSAFLGAGHFILPPLKNAASKESVSGAILLYAPAGS